MVGKKQNVAPKWKNLMKNVDLDESISLLDHENLGCTQRECKPKQITIDEYRFFFESRISAEALDKLPGWEKMLENTLREIASWKSFKFLFG